MTYSGHLGSQYTSLGAQTLVPKSIFQVFFFQFISTKIFFYKSSMKNSFAYWKLLSNLKNVLQTNLKTERARKCIFRVSGSTNIENFSAQCQHGSTITIKSPDVITYVCQNFGIHVTHVGKNHVSGVIPFI